MPPSICTSVTILPHVLLLQAVLRECPVSLTCNLCFQNGSVFRPMGASLFRQQRTLDEFLRESAPGFTTRKGNRGQ